MPAEDANTGTLQNPTESNAEAANDVKKMLAELKGDTEPKVSEEANSATNKVNGNTESQGKNGVATEDKENDDRHPDRRHQRADEDDEPRDRRDRDRDSRNGRGHRGGHRGRGGGRGDFKPHNKRENIKSNLIQEKESDDPVAIRKQVRVLFFHHYPSALTRYAG
jgi:hypothetical protein